MNEGLSENIYNVSIDVDLMVRNETRDKNGIIASVSVSVENQWSMSHVETIMPEILVHVLVSVTKIMILVKNCECMISLVDDIAVICNEIKLTPKSAPINSYRLIIVFL